MYKITFIFIYFFILFYNSIQSQTPEKTYSIDVTGDAVVKVVPDLMNFSLTIQTDNDNIVTAKNDNDRAITKVLEILKVKGILEKDIQTGGIRIYKNYQYDYQEKKVKAFTVYNSIGFQLKDLSKYYEITTELIKIDYVLISYSNYDYSNIIETRKHARELALKAAKDKAQEMAAVLGLDIGKPITISEEPTYEYYPNPTNNVSQQGTQNYTGSSYTLEEGTMKVEAKVRVVFELVSR